MTNTPECGHHQRPHHAHGKCRHCYDKWRRGSPIDGRIEDYAWLRLEQHLDRSAAAARVGITERTAWRYEARLREKSAA